MLHNLLFLGNLGFPEYVIIFGAFLLMFGGKKISELMRGIGKGVREFNSARANLEDEFKQGIRDSEKKTTTTTTTTHVDPEV